MQQNGVWHSVWNGPTFSYSSNSPTSIAFRLTVAYESGISDTSEPLTVTWTGEPPPVAVDRCFGHQDSLGRRDDAGGNTLGRAWRTARR